MDKHQPAYIISADEIHHQRTLEDVAADIQKLYLQAFLRSEEEDLIKAMMRGGSCG